MEVLFFQMEILFFRRHYFLDSLKNNASFKDASLNKFYTKSKLSNQDSLYLQGEIDFTHN